MYTIPDTEIDIWAQLAVRLLFVKCITRIAEHRDTCLWLRENTPR